jgi:hypothetical protein
VHEADIVRLSDGVTAEQYIAWLDGGEVGTPPARVVTGAGSFVKGRVVWMSAELPPGRYLLICQEPEPKSGKPHYELGMVWEFEVK